MKRVIIPLAALLLVLTAAPVANAGGRLDGGKYDWEYGQTIHDLCAFPITVVGHLDRYLPLRGEARWRHSRSGQLGRAGHHLGARGDAHERLVPLPHRRQAGRRLQYRLADCERPDRCSSGFPTAVSSGARAWSGTTRSRMSSPSRPTTASRGTWTPSARHWSSPHPRHRIKDARPHEGRASLESEDDHCDTQSRIGGQHLESGRRANSRPDP